MSVAEAELVLARDGAERFAARWEIPTVADDQRDQNDKDLWLALLREENASEELIAAVRKAREAEVVAIVLGNGRRFSKANPPSALDEREAWLAWREACAAVVALRNPPPSTRVG
jgi:uncharacterized protein (UPF0216 family)